jgi:hypothetical protein
VFTPGMINVLCFKENKTCIFSKLIFTLHFGNKGVLHTHYDLAKLHIVYTNVYALLFSNLCREDQSTN